MPHKKILIIFLFTFLFCWNYQETYSADADHPSSFYFRSYDISSNESEFLSHDWVKKYVTDLFSRFGVISIDDPSFNLEILGRVKFNSMEFSELNGFEQWNQEEKAFKNFKGIFKAHTIRTKFDLSQFLPKLDGVLQRVVCDKARLNDRQAKVLSSSFLNVQRTLVCLREDLEIASFWLDEKKHHPQFNTIKANFLQHTGRLFFIEKTVDTRKTAYTASGTVVNVRGKKFILTCRHLGSIKEEAEHEIYFIPHDKLNQEDFEPLNRAKDDPESIAWESYAHYKINRLHLYNSENMESTLTLWGAYNRTINENSLTHLNAAEIANFKKLNDLQEHNDIAFMEVTDPAVLSTGMNVKGALNESKTSHNLMAAGYPGGGLSGCSFAVVGSTQSQVYSSIVRTKAEQYKQSRQYFKICNFPIVGGMSGGPVFLCDGTNITIVGILHGVDIKSCIPLYSLIPHKMLEILMNRDYQ